MLQIEACLAVLKLWSFGTQYFPERKIFVSLLLSKSLFEDTFTDEEALCLSDSTCSVYIETLKRILLLIISSWLTLIVSKQVRRKSLNILKCRDNKRNKIKIWGPLKKNEGEGDAHEGLGTNLRVTGQKGKK
ncbi:unnamed protein product [Brassica oleracea var. botrytis]